MAPSNPAHRRNGSHLHAAASSRVGASKAQAGLAKILAIISAAQLPNPRPHHDGGGVVDPEKETGFRVDLRLRLAPSPEMGGGSANGDSPTAGSVVVDASAPAGSDGGESASRNQLAASAAGSGDALTVAKSSEGECDPEGESREETAEGHVKEKAEGMKGNGGLGKAGTTTPTSIKTCSGSNRKRGIICGGEGCFDLLLEAARQVSGDAFDGDVPGAENLEPAAAADEEEPLAPLGRTRAKKHREEGESWIPFDLYAEETAPIVRSKRGRSQTLPSRYRDSILDPWRKLTAMTRHDRAARP